MTSFARVEHFIEESKRAATPHELEELMAGITTDLGFDYFALIQHVNLGPMAADLSHMKAGSLVALTNYPPEWVEEYVCRNLVVQDPVHLAAHRTSVGFRWDQIGDLIKITAEHRAMWADAARWGIADGYTVPANLPGEPKGTCSFAVRVGRSLPEANLLMAQTVGAFAFEAARAMMERTRRGRRKGAQASLTPRQLECVVLIGRGRTDAEIARALGLREQTVTEHINEARERYQVRRRAQLVIQAIYRGDIHFLDILGDPAP